MSELDDRLVGDPVWELFPARTAGPLSESRIMLVSRSIAWACAVAAFWVLSPPVAILLAAVLISAPDFRSAWHVARSIPDKGGGVICALVGCAWGAWKFALIALAFAVSIAMFGSLGSEMLSPFVTSTLAAICAHALSAALTAAGVIGACCFDMRIWVGEGVNRARLLILTMLLVIFTFVVIAPACIGLALLLKPGGAPVHLIVLASSAVSVGGAVVLLLILDWLAARVVADRPARFGQKVPAVGKWNTQRRDWDTAQIQVT